VSPDAEYPLDGISLLPCLMHPPHQLSRTVFWRMKHRTQRAIRHGNWKYLSVDGHDYLFDLSRDARERANMLRREPGILEDLRRRYADWAQSMPDIPPEAGVELVYTQEDMP